MSSGSAAVGTWDLSVRTPIGTVGARVTIRDAGGVLSGEAVGRSETVALQDLRVVREGAGERVTWRQSVTRPMRLDLEFDVVVTGDVLAGTSRAGRLPSSAVTGRRS